MALTWDMDADSGLNYYHKDRADTLVASQSFVRYGPRVAIPRIVEAFSRFSLRQTFFIPGWCIEKYPAVVDLLLSAGHEVALHGYLHERPNELSAEDEHYWMRRGIDAFVARVGTRPRGWRAPSFAFSKHSLNHLVEEGFQYDASLMGDDVPYLLECDRGSLIELASEWTNDDWPYYMHNRDLNYFMPISAPQRAMEVYRAEFDAAWENGGMWITVWHPFVSGRLSRITAIVDFIKYVSNKGGVWFARLDEIADHVRKVVSAGEWLPHRERLPLYRSPIPEFTRE